MSKKLLEVTPEAIERRRLRTRSDAFSGEAEYMAKMAASSMSENAGRGGKDEMSDVLDSPCRRRLVSDSGSDGRRRLGVQGCVSFTGGDATAFSVNLARTGGKTQDHSRTVAVHLNDPQLQDTFAIRVASDPTYGQPRERANKGPLREGVEKTRELGPRPSFPVSPRAARSKESTYNFLS